MAGQSNKLISFESSWKKNEDRERCGVPQLKKEFLVKCRGFPIFGCRLRDARQRVLDKEEVKAIKRSERREKEQDWMLPGILSDQVMSRL